MAFREIRELIVERHGVRFVEFFADRDYTENQPHAKIYFCDGSLPLRIDNPEHVRLVITNYLHRGDIAEEITKKEEDVHLILKGPCVRPICEPASYHPGVMDCEYNLYIW